MGRYLPTLAGIAVIVLAMTAPSALAASGHPDVVKGTLRATTASHSAGVPVLDLAGTGVINGTVRDYSGTPLPGAYVWWRTAGGSAGNTTITDANGFYQFNDVPALNGNGELLFLFGKSWNPLFYRSGVGFTGAGTFDCWPG
jgi:hypothetical protein